MAVTMITTYLYLGLLFLHIYGKHSVLASNGFTKLIKREELDGRTCPADKTLFKDNANVTQCAVKCSKMTSCYGVVQYQQAVLCVGCQSLPSGSAPTIDGAHFYIRKVHKGYTVVEEIKTWNDSKKHCVDLGGHLVDIQSAEEEMFIETYVISAYNTDKQAFWIGGNDISIEGIFLWQDGTNVSNHYVNWRPSEPTGFSPTEDCMQLRNYRGKWQWNDDRCERNKASLCEDD